MLRPWLVCVCVLASAGLAGATSLPAIGGMYQGSQPLPMLASRVEVIVRGAVVETVVTQTFTNPTTNPTEAIYIFPLPADAAVTAMQIRSGGRTITAGIERREQAQRRYEEAVAAGVGAGLLDQERSDVFTQTVSAIPAKGTVEVALRYDTVATYHDGTWQLIVPMVVAPRFVPGTASGQPTIGSGRSPDTNRAPDASRITPHTTPGGGGPTEMTIEIVDAHDAATSPTHELTVVAGKARLIDRRSDHDAIVRWRAPVPTSGWSEDDGESGFAAVVVSAPKAPAKLAATRCTLAIDRAATTRGDADAVERPLVKSLLKSFEAASRVAVIGSDSLPWSSPDQTARALDAAWSRRAGALDISRMLATARPDGAPLVLVSDGLVADDAQVIAAARKLGVPIHVIGVGAAPARSLLAQIASVSGGTVRFAIPGDDLDALAHDVVADVVTQPTPVAVTWGTLAASDVVPSTMPRLGAGQAKLVLARIKHATRANGRAGGDLFSIETVRPQRRVDGSTTKLGVLGRRWARDRLDEIVAARAKPAAITAHAMQYGLVSPYTSMVAIGTDVVVQGGVKHSIGVPVSVPAGMRWQPVRHETTVAIDETTATGHDQPAEPPPPPPAAPPAKPTVDRESTKNIPVPTRTMPVAKAPVQEKPSEPKKELDNKNQKDAQTKQDGKKRPPAVSEDALDTAADAKTSKPENKPRTDATDDDDDGDQPRKGRYQDDSTKKKHNKKKAGDSAGEDAVSSAAKADEDAEPTLRSLGATATADVLETSVVSSASRRYRLGLSLGGGLDFRGGTSGMAALSGRFERNLTWRSSLGLDGSLWLVGSRPDVQGRLLFDFARHGIARFVELGIGAGVHLGDGVGPAGALRLRMTAPPLGHFGLFLRYDAALLYQGGDSHTTNALILGLDYEL